MAGERPEDSDQRDGVHSNKEPETQHSTEANSINAFSSLQVSLLLHPTKKLNVY